MRGAPLAPLSRFCCCARGPQVLGTYAATIPSAALCSSDHLNAAAPTPDLARLLLSPEAEEGTRFAESRLVPFRASFEGAARDPHLKDRLLGEGPHILAWLVEAAGEFLRSGLPPCRVIEDYRDQQDTLGDFLADHCTKGGETASSDVFRAYQAWCVSHGVRHSWTQKALTVRLTDYRRNGWHITSRRTASVRLLAGVSLRSPF